MSNYSALSDVLRAEIAGFDALNRILDEEHAALLGADADRLLSLSQDKARAVESLDDLARIRSDALQALSLDPRAPNFQLQLAAASQALATLWRSLVGTADAAQTRNRTNGDLLATRMAHNRTALDTLNTVARRHSVYGPDGQSVIQPANRTLGQA